MITKVMPNAMMPFMAERPPSMVIQLLRVRKTGLMMDDATIRRIRMISIL